MDYKVLNNGVEMPMEGFGVFQISESECERVVADAVAAGYRSIDTASSYGNEEAVGRALRTCGIGREELFITTKAYIHEMGYDRTRQAFERSLRKLQTDYLDLYLIHMPLADYYGAWRAMEELYAEGRVRAVGVCNFDEARLLDLCYNAQVRPMVNQIELHPHFQRAAEIEAMRGLGVEPEGWAPFAEGLKGMFAEPLLHEIAGKHGRTVPQVILRWNVQRGVAVIPKTVRRERMVENLAIWDFALDTDDMARIATLDKGVPSMLDLGRSAEVRRVYGYLDNPVLTTLTEK
ncbi:aldo/keto reductase [Rikenella microfusus]|uniref:2,5-diketo-D-gluconic acid reductase A n=1 Tax=Rikenella microfusus TaxID=28139 RepID=A0A379MPU4_9BACT|nr:aldo/keto reductase [Rikenella microfusus]SUE33545.1 2,5-diketo-D-gluconic acid reductase A [Rikenella microfusus]